MVNNKYKKKEYQEPVSRLLESDIYNDEDEIEDNQLLLIDRNENPNTLWQLILCESEKRRETRHNTNVLIEPISTLIIINYDIRQKNRKGFG